MRHVTFTLIVESENINSIRALCFDACFQHTKKPIVRIEMFHPPKIYSDSLQHENHQFQKHSSESSEIKKGTERTEMNLVHDSRSHVVILYLF